VKKIKKPKPSRKKIEGHPGSVDPSRYLALMTKSELHLWYLKQDVASKEQGGLPFCNTEYRIWDVLTLSKNWLAGLGDELSVQELAEEVTPSTIRLEHMDIELPVSGPVGNTIIQDSIVRFTHDPYVQNEVSLPAF